VDNGATWKLIHDERASIAETFEALSPAQWSEPSLCQGWSVQDTAGHILNGAEQTPGKFFCRMALNGFRFNKMIDTDARMSGRIPSEEIIDRLRRRLTTTNRPPATVVTMLGEVVVHSEDIRRPLQIQSTTKPEAIVAALELFTKTGFPLNSKQRIAGVRLIASDLDWSHGDGPQITGSGLNLLLAMTGRSVGLAALAGDGVEIVRARSKAGA
jgi:uncharacterized protein (TIGR03083 family)